ncbi:complement component C9 [Alligator sinensis]|uniref:Complement component C9 n=1 Tax=Alligator sinensis TaxID=38654 RepID=A0A1U7S0D5_ALLSI|nr:complement component C9 [Alligator sinensis]
MNVMLQLVPLLCVLESNIMVSGESRGSSETALHRDTRQLNAPSPIDCKLSSWSEWGPCDPCLNQRFRSRSIVRFGQFGGRKCLESLGDTQKCNSNRACLEMEADCGADFTCDSGRCVKMRLMCNVDNDCGDYSDENDCEAEPRSPCRNQDIDVSEIGRTAGHGINILGMQPMASPFENEYFNGLCERVRDGNTKTYYRKPWNVAVLNYDTRADKSFTTESYHDRVEVFKEVLKTKQEYFEYGMVLKLKPTEKTKEALNFSSGYKYSAEESFHSILHYDQERNQTFLLVKGKVQLGRFQMRSRDVRLTDAFLDDLNFLPVEYDKGEYFRFLENYGTHYAVSGTVGGKYELVYVLDNYAMNLKGIRVEDVKKCLGYHLDTSLVSKDLDYQLKIKGGKCENITITSTLEKKHDAVIDDVLSFVDGGKIDFSVKIKEMLLRGAQVVDIQDYLQWATSLVDAPVVIQQRPSPIHTLVPVKMRDAHTKKQNLERAIEDYVTEHSVCKCKPCQNGGTLVVIDGECICMCSSYFKGIACQIAKGKESEAKQVTNGGWSCWTPWSPCVRGEHSRTRQCNNPDPGPGGKQCEGESIETSFCAEEL